jgi:hypothetical protein
MPDRSALVVLGSDGVAEFPWESDAGVFELEFTAIGAASRRLALSSGQARALDGRGTSRPPPPSDQRGHHVEDVDCLVTWMANVVVQQGQRD